MPYLIQSDAKDLGESTEGFGCRHIVRTDVNTVYAIYINEDNNLVVCKSTNQGQTWSVDYTFTPESGYVIKYPCIAAISNKVYVGYVDRLLSTTTHKFKVYKRDPSTEEWSQIYLLDFTSRHTDDVLGFGIVASRFVSGRLHLVGVYHNADNGFYGLFHKFTDDDSNWSSTYTYQYGYSSGSISFSIYDIASSPTDGRVVIFLYTGSYQIVRFQAGGPGLSSSSFSMGDPPPHGSGSLVVDSSGVEHVVGTFGPYYGNYYIRYGNSTISGERVKQGHLNMGIDGQGNLHLFYTKYSDGKCYYRKRRADGQWESEIQYSTSTGLRPKAESVSPSSSNIVVMTYYSDTTV